jgi:hypothetical protein
MKALAATLYPTSLARDRRGGILVVTLFTSSLLIGVLFFMLAVGRSIRHGETLGDAADGSAFSGAVMHARAMNLIALMNMVKLSVVAVATALMTVTVATARTIGWILDDWWRRMVYGWNIPFLAAIGLQAGSTYMSNQGKYSEVVEAADQAQTVLKDELALLASFQVDQIAGSFEGVDRGFIAPARRLPIKRDSVQDLCNRAMPFGWSIVHKAHNGIPLAPVKNRANGYAGQQILPFCLARGVSAFALDDDAKMGGEAFQVRAYALGPAVRDLEDRGVRVATWMRDDAVSEVGTLKKALTRIGLAQGEYYFDGDAAEANLLWHMQWRARMRRFREPEGFAAFAAGCAMAGGGADCATAARALLQGQSLIIH